VDVDIRQVGNRGVLFSFDDIGGITNVYVINGTKHIFIIDTFIGPKAMEPVNSYIKSNMEEKPIIIVNTHYHWDHVWGNCAYKIFPIVAHEKSLEYLTAKGEADLKKHEEYAKGEVEITLPNIIFSERLMFEEDRIKLFHSPGHTEDSITIYDEQDQVLIIGDNLERPIPYLMDENLDVYLKTLQSYLDMDFDIIIGGHIGLEGKQLIFDNAKYIRGFIEDCILESDDEEYKCIHEFNKKLRTHK
jgi:glyoxylase-like metal-dependent hydrolase (beta-lactamase superfamily II)